MPRSLIETTIFNANDVASPRRYLNRSCECRSVSQIGEVLNVVVRQWSLSSSPELILVSNCVAKNGADDFGY